MLTTTGPDRFWRAEPTTDLLPYVQCYLGRRAITRRERFAVFPGGQVELLFHFGDPFLVGSTASEKWSALPKATLLGPRLTQYWQLAGPKIDWFIVQLTPLGCHRMVGQPLGSLIGVDQPLCTGGRDCGADTWEQMAHCDDFAVRLKVAERWLRSRLSDGPSDDAGLSRLISMMRSRPIPSVDLLAGELGIGPRRLRQRFEAELGASPKYWLSMLRAARLAHQLHPGTRAEPEAVFEYADQSHASREFKRFTGMSPGRYIVAKHDGDMLVNTGPREVAKDVGHEGDSVSNRLGSPS